MEVVAQDPEQQMEDLMELAKVFKNALDLDHSLCCPKCGYVKPCESDVDCEKRLKVFKEANFYLVSTLKATSFWYMAVNLKDDFLETDLMQRVRSLVCMGDLDPSLGK